MVSTSQKSLHSLLATNLKKLTITPPSSSPDFDFTDVFGPLTPHHTNQSSPSTSAFLGDPQVIHNRSHSFVGPSPRYTLSSSPLPLQIEELKELENENENENEREEEIEKSERKIGPGDFEILRVVGQGAFGKVFQVRKKGDFGGGGGGDDEDGIYAMKVMRKQTIIKKNHVDYMKAERDILTKPPYTHASRQKLQQRIINGKVKPPPYLTSEAHSLIKGLLQKDPSKRLDSGPSGGDDIKHHNWFRSINWKKLEARELQPKFKPDMSGKDCTTNFKRCWTTMPLDDSPAPTPTAGEHFQGYSYVAPNPWLSSE